MLINPSGREVNGYPNKDGYIRATIRYKGKAITYLVHRLAAYQKYGRRLFEPGIQVRHLDGDSSNYSLSNIAIGTASENQLDKTPLARHRSARAAACKTRRLTQDQANDLREKRAGGWLYKDLCDFFKLSKSTVSDIVNHRTYKY